jgi:hypothetical protein
VKLDTQTVAFAHRAMVEVVVAGLIKPRRGLRVVADDVRDGAGATAGESKRAGAAVSARAGASADLLVMTDDREVADEALEGRMTRARAAVGDVGIVALVVGSVTTSELVDAARRVDIASGALRERGDRGDAYVRAVTWARALEETAAAPAVTPERLGRLVDAAAAAGLTLVEPETAAIVPALARVRGLRSPRARAILATIALGSAARPLLLVPTGRAPKGGLARLKVERLADGWVAARTSARRAVGDASLRDGDATDGGLALAALTILDDAARAGAGALLFKELLRAARERWTAAARARGQRATVSGSDAAELATSLHRRAAHESVVLYVLDPSDPGWIVG